MSPAELDHWLSQTPRRCLVMGVLNVTPDSFSDGGRYFDPAAAVSRAKTLIADGADLLDVGGESTRPGSDPVSEAEQLRRVIPVIAALNEECPSAISIDTTRSAVAAGALDAGACLINDISGGIDDPAILALAAARSVPIVLMHMQGTPKTMQVQPSYIDVSAEVAAFLLARVDAAVRSGVARGRILLDPGIGFGKKLEHNLKLLRDLSALAKLGYPLLVGTSRKSFIDKITGETDSTRPFGTAASVAWAVANGAAIVRVHDVRQMRAVVSTIRAIIG